MASTYETLLLALTAQLAVPVNATPQSAASNGTASSGAVETFDAVLGYYQCQLIAGRRYMAVMNNLVGNAGVAGDTYQFQIRNSNSASNPTSASTLVAQQQWTAQYAGGASRIPICMAGSFVASASGTNTFGFSSTKTSGTGPFTPVSPPNLARELFVIYLGAV
jgi:hypothetical protein